MKNKKGFTLIELLAVIVILAVIALIATPIIMNVINDAKKGAFKDSLYSLIKATENYQMKLMDSSDSSFVVDLPSDILNIKNGDFTEGYIGISKAGKVSFLAGNGKFCATKDFDDDDIKIMDGNCDSQTPKKCFATNNDGKNISEYLCDGAHDGYEKITDVIIPRQIVDGVDVITTDNGGNKGIFYNKKINSLFLPNTIKVLGDSTGRNNNFKGILIPNSVTTMYDDCFATNQLTNVVIPKTVTHIGYMAFSANKLPENQAYVYGRDSAGNPTSMLVSYGGHATEVYVPEGTETIGDMLL